MLTKYRSSIRANLTSVGINWFSPAMNAHWMSRARILDKWFYFYVNKPREPVVVWVSQHCIAVHPGTNRLIGCLLRAQNIVLPALVIKQNPSVFPKDLGPMTEIACCDLPWPQDINSSSEPAIQWAVGNETSFNRGEWKNEVFGWVRDNLNYVWALKYQSRVYCVNWGKHWGFKWGVALALSKYLRWPRPLGGVVDAADYHSLDQAVQVLFKKIVEKEGIQLE